jgi:multisubunit Na+/H+ antiporter MnhG subunit
MATGGTIIKEIAFFGHIFLATGGSALNEVILCLFSHLSSPTQLHCIPFLKGATAKTA